MGKLKGCISKNLNEIDGKEFAVETLEELIDILKENKEVHIWYFEGEEDLDLWLKVE